MVSRATARYSKDAGINRRIAAVRELLSRAGASIGDVDEPLAHAYFRRSLDLIPHPDSFLELVILAPMLGRGGILRRRRQTKELFELILSFHDWRRTLRPADALERAFRHDPGRSYLRVNIFEGIEWFDRERYGDFVFRMYALALIDLYAELPVEKAALEEKLLFTVIGQWVEALHRANYQVEKLLSSYLRTVPPTAASSSMSPVSKR